MGPNLFFHLMTTYVAEGGLRIDFGPCEEIQCVRAPRVIEVLNHINLGLWNVMCEALTDD